ncbi:unnamed protein product [Ostreobium quekettii]|uniref:Protease Do-like PDZ domain-containing protein n=1 Tax=Ostreobium quekettii TaxID=121088 RepID=A0A8S1J303_9CHLO|nr:unnamed protein product [Ostreobium quekettii]CAD7701774.1 unnamed protein product [Ostreobium quekettii]|eukprot:evm.model.scf_1383EXC.1 EVM.evm.TU.scf_1383EXC.1   scf_1383EXC:12391-18191(+)
MLALRALNRLLAQHIRRPVVGCPWQLSPGCASSQACLNNGAASGSRAVVVEASRGSRARRLKCDNGVGEGWESVDYHSESGGDAYDDGYEEDPNDPHRAELLNAVVKVYCKHTEPNFSLPWQKKRQFSSTSSGFMVSDGPEKRPWVLTNAHSVAYHSQVQVKRRDTEKKFIARVLAVGTDCDVALLMVDDKEFWKGVEPLPLGSLPKLQDYVTVVGYPVGGDSLSVTAGVVSRIEVTHFCHGSCDLLGVQIDAAINSGNSGGPVFSEAGYCVGIAFQSYAGSDAENIGYVIPTPVIRHFLQDYSRNKKVTGFPALGITYQRLDAKDIRESCGLKEGQSGVMVRSVNPTSNSFGVLEVGDVLMEFDGVKIACDGTVPFRTSERIMFTFLVANKFVGNMADLLVLRDGTPTRLQFELGRPQALVPSHLNGKNPSYFVVAGCVFTSLSEPYLANEFGMDYATESPVKLLEKVYFGIPKKKGHQVVLLSQVLANEATVGYEDMENVPVVAFNGTPVENLCHLSEMVVNCKEKYMTFDLEYHQVIVLATEAAKAATDVVLEEYSIPNMASPDVREHLEKEKAGSGKRKLSERPSGAIRL